MKFTFIIAATLLVMSTPTSANLISNGDFQTCDFTHWGLDTDGFGEPADTSNFTIIDEAGQCSAQVSTGNPFATEFANTLFTNLDLSSVSPDAILDLQFDWTFSGFDLQTDEFSDAFSVVLNNGMDLEELLFVFEDGSGTFFTQLDASYDGFSLDFALLPGFNAESYASIFTLDNVALTERVEVTAPHTSLLIAFGLCAVALRRKLQQQ
ncbi:hypothetical protein IT774_02900 [Salinimonas marina]|uniref:PEP-CTERM protein-sorting domain-containing protein n=1 Tax=Salinimonas marina TaxID=2785918 RepID=A0A7S9DYG3_9ALTE|nr:hypothetical protein [Salinimonas marina]QPG06180.1 hypothetical protein IT774_02900 [Salinimonas marina]